MADSFLMTIVAILTTLCIAHLLIEFKRPKLWFVMPVIWFLFILPNLLLGYFLQNSLDAGIDSYVRLLMIILKYSIPSFVMIGFHIIIVIIRKYQRPRVKQESTQKME